MCANEFVYAKIASVAGGLIFSYSVFFLLHSRTLSLSLFDSSACALKLFYMQHQFHPVKHLLNVWFYANANTVNGLWSGTHVSALTKVSVFFTLTIRIFITPFNNIECDILCLFIGFYCRRRCCVRVCFFPVSVRLPIHSYAIVTDSLFYASL